MSNDSEDEQEVFSSKNRLARSPIKTPIRNIDFEYYKKDIKTQETNKESKINSSSNESINTSISTKQITTENNSEIPNKNIFDWRYETESNMAAMSIKDVTDLIKEFNGEKKTLVTFTKNISKLWEFIEEYSENDKNRFLLVLRLKLPGKAADAIKKL